MVRIGLIVEGFYDEAALSEFVRKSASFDVEVICRTCGNAIQVMKKFPALLKQFEHANAGRPVDKAIVIRDADHKNPDELIANMNDKISGRSYSFPVDLLVVVEEMEAWLLADETALVTVTGRPQQRVLSPETIYDPKVRLKNILSNSRITYTAERARQIAGASNIDVLSERCPNFQKFREAVVRG
ncbi:MAG: DUF4276 family protein [Candidatus Binatia bacterium]